MFPRVEEITWHRTSRWRPALYFQSRILSGYQSVRRSRKSLRKSHDSQIKNNIWTEAKQNFRFDSRKKWRNQIQWSSWARCQTPQVASSSVLFPSHVALIVPLRIDGDFFIPSRWKPSYGRFRLMFLARLPFRASPLDGICAPRPHGSPTLP